MVNTLDMITAGSGWRGSCLGSGCRGNVRLTEENEG